MSGGSGTYSSFTAYCFALNFILGVGILGLPYAFQKSGYVLAVVALTFCSILAYIVILWIIEIGRRANALKSWRAVGGSRTGSVQGLLDSPESPAGQPAPEGVKLELNELCEVILGPVWRRAFDVLFFCVNGGFLWAYAAVFAQSIASQVAIKGLNNGETCDITKDSSSECHNLYLVWLAIFACFACPISTLELTETKLLAIGLAFFRFIAIFLMLGTAIDSMWHYPVEALKTVVKYTDAPYYSDITAFEWPGIGIIIPIAITAMLFHSAVPSLSFYSEKKRELPKVYLAVVVSTLFLYSAVGIVVGLYFGSTVESVCTLNWQHYTGSSSEEAPKWAIAIRTIIVLFPPIDISSAFPLNANVLGNNICGAFYGPSGPETPRLYRAGFRLMAAIPPIIGACFVYDLGKILSFMGILSVFLYFTIPSIMQYQSKQLMKGDFSRSSAALEAAAAKRKKNEDGQFDITTGDDFETHFLTNSHDSASNSLALQLLLPPVVLPEGGLEKIINSDWMIYVVFIITAVAQIACWVLFFLDLAGK